VSYNSRFQEDLKDAMRSGDTQTRDTLRLLVAAIKYKRIELGREPNEAEELQVLQKQVKMREDSVAQYGAAARQDLVDKERAEIAVIERYLPQRMSDDDVRAVVERTIREVGASSKADLGKVMKAVMAAHQGQVDGKAVQRIAGELLG
jgi:uncharacterized protein YqeY